MRILVLGADGMLGHQLVAAYRDKFEVAGTVRLARDSYHRIMHWLPSRLYDRVDAQEFSSVEAVMRDFRPNALINAIGIVKQRAESKQFVESIAVNSLLPHKLAMACAEISSRFVQISTDCVFSGRRGGYTDTDVADAEDLYGRSKLLGEVVAPGAITLRTSIIGPELTRKASLLEWFLAQEGSIRGYRRAIFSGFTTFELARIIEQVISTSRHIDGLYNVSSDPIDKYQLLCGLKDRLRKKIEIVADDDFFCDRSLVSTRFRADFGYRPPPWSAMLDELAVKLSVR